jgi:hypothetical protein
MIAGVIHAGVDHGERLLIVRRVVARSLDTRVILRPSNYGTIDLAVTGRFWEMTPHEASEVACLER